MNKNLQQILDRYVNNFDIINDSEHDENFKWQIAKTFPELMDQALSSDVEEFPEALNTVRLSTGNMIDNFALPFLGMVEFAKKEPKTVKQMFTKLYREDGGDLVLRQRKIEDFISEAADLQEMYYPEYFRYKQSFHAVSTYLFLYDPDHHYIFQASKAKSFAECINFNEDWGEGNKIDLQIYYNMCDKVLEEISECETLMEADRSRFKNRFALDASEMIEDKEKHLLLWDIIFCAYAYNMYTGIRFRKLSAKERALYSERQHKAIELAQEYDDTVGKKRLLDEARAYFKGIYVPDRQVIHKVYGPGVVKSIDGDRIHIYFPKKEEEKTLVLPVLIGNKIISIEDEEYKGKADLFRPVIQKGDSIYRTLERLHHALKEYREFLE